jgi:hypothetical protein
MTPVEQKLNPGDPGFIWNCISGFPGYEMCVAYDGSNKVLLLRSLKSIHRYPYGTLLEPRNNYYELTDRNNNRVRVNANDLQIDPYNIPRHTWEVDSYKARNKREFINPNEETLGTVIRKPVDIKAEENNTLSYPKFN